MTEKQRRKNRAKARAIQKKPKPQQEVVVQIPLSELHPFPDHPFQVREDASMRKPPKASRNTASSSPAGAATGGRRL